MDVESRFEEITTQYGAFLRSAIAKLCPPRLGLHTADIEQEAKVRLWQALKSEREITNLASYLHRIAATTTIDAVRRAKSRREDQLRLEGEEDEDGPPTPLPVSDHMSPEVIARRKELMALVRRALDNMSDNRRRIVELYLQGVAPLEAGRILGWSEPKARNLLYRGLADLREELRTLGVDVATE